MSHGGTESQREGRSELIEVLMNLSLIDLIVLCVSASLWLHFVFQQPARLSEFFHV
jgi:hypothetical protein